MFEPLRAHDKDERISQVSGQYADGIALYKAFKEALHAQDRARAPRLAVKVDSYYNALTETQQADFCAILVREELLTGPLAGIIKTFEGRVVRWTMIKPTGFCYKCGRVIPEGKLFCDPKDRSCKKEEARGR